MANAESNLNSFSDEFLQKTKTLFEPIAGRELSQENCRDIARTIIDLELYLRKLKEKYEPQR